MSNEITNQQRLRIRNGNLEHDWQPSADQIDQSSQIASGGVLSIPTGTSATAISLGGVTTAAWSHFRNIDTSTASTVYIDIGTGSGTSFVATLRLLPGEYTIAPLHPTNAPYARLNTSATATAALEFWIGSR